MCKFQKCKKCVVKNHEEVFEYQGQCYYYIKKENPSSHCSVSIYARPTHIAESKKHCENDIAVFEIYGERIFIYNSTFYKGAPARFKQLMEAEIAA